MPVNVGSTSRIREGPMSGMNIRIKQQDAKEASEM